MISAQEAHKETLKNVQNRTTEELLGIENDIKDAISKGEHFIYRYHFLSAEAGQTLRTLGYTVETMEDHNDVNYKISW